MHSHIDLSVMFFSADERASSKFDFVLDVVKFAEESGFKAIWFPERHFHRFGGLFPNPALLCAAAARETKRIRLRAGSVVLPLHDVLRVCEDWSVVDHLSGGRVDMAFASGWDANSFCLMPDRFSDRHATTLAMVDEFRRLWRGGAASRMNGVSRPTTVSPLPSPVQAEPGIWLTAARNPAVFEEAESRGLNVLTALLFQSIEQLEERIGVYRRARERAGHDPKTGRITLMLHTLVAADDDSARSVVAAPLREYMATSIDLWRNESKTLDTLDEKERALVVELAMHRYVRGSGLIGGREHVVAKLADLQRLGVDEVACLIDFGVDEGAVWDSLVRLAACQRHGATSADEQRGEERAFESALKDEGLFRAARRETASAWREPESEAQ